MKTVGKGIPSGWSFFGGTVLGVLAALALPGSIHVASSKAPAEPAIVRPAAPAESTPVPAVTDNGSDRSMTDLQLD